MSAASPFQTYKRLIAQLAPYKGVFALAVLGMLVVAGGETAFAWLMKPLMDQGFVDREPGALTSLPLWLIAIMAVRALGQVVDSYALDWVGRRVIFDLREKMFARMVHLPASYYDAASSASLVSKLVYDAEQVSSATTNALRVVVRDSLHSLLLLGLMFYHSWKMTLVFLAVVPVAAWILRVSSRRFRATSTDIQGSVGDITHVSKEALQGHEVVKAFNAFEQEKARFAGVNESNRRHFMRRAKVLAISVPLTLFVASVALAGIIAYALSLSGSEQISPGTFVSYIAATVMLMQPLRRLSKINETIQTGIAAASSIFAVLDTAPEADEGSEDFAAPVAGEVRFEQVSFQYAGSEQASLKAVNFVAPAKAKVALVGVSGSGKTTAMKLLMRQYAGFEGKILIDGLDVQTLGLRALRDQIALVSQKPMLFDDSIRANIIYGSPVDGSGKGEAHFKAVVDAAKVSDFAEKLPEQYETRVGENGARLSGGQQQRVAIARALYANAPILILDEATSALDSQSEQQIQAAIDALLENRTAFMIAHRLSTIQNADLILVFDGGEIVERGTHGELLEKAGVYAALHAAQQSAEQGV